MQIRLLSIVTRIEVSRYRHLILALPYVCAIGLAFFVAGPWFLPGYLFGTDWPGPRNFRLPDEIWSGAGWQAALASISGLIGAELTTKVFIAGALIAAALGAFRAVAVGGFVARAAAATLYTINPFLYGRIHYGQLALVAAYSVLPWLLIELRKLVIEPGVVAALATGALLALIGVLDLHVLLLAAVLAAAIGLAFATARLRQPGYLVRLAASAIAAAGLVFVASAYWLIPLVKGSNPQGLQIADFSVIDLGVFRTVADPKLGLLPNVLGLYGFWAENVSRFPSMKDFVPFWPAALSAILLVAGIGAAASLWRPASNVTRPWTIGLLVAGSLALLLAMGVAQPQIAPLVHWLDMKFPAYRGMRDAEKWSALIVLVYAQLFPAGVAAIVASTRRWRLAHRFQWLNFLAAGLLAALPLYYGNGLLFGMHGQVRASMYPGGWYQADRALISDKQPGTTLFLPWHLYLKFGFIHNANSVIASPAPSFFSVPVLVSADPEVPGLRPANTVAQALIGRLVSAGADANWPQALATINVKYVILAREVDWRNYQYLDHQLRLNKVKDYGSVVLYRNLDWRPR